MATLFRCFRSVSRFLQSPAGVAACLLVSLAVSHAAAQNTTISGTVYDPRTTSASLPLPNVLVYATTNPVAALVSGVQCLTYQSPTGVVSYAYSDVQGNFTLTNIPENAAYTIVIQAGKWRRQFPNIEVAAAPVTGLALHMPSNHTQGDIPMIAVVTGSVDGVECVLRDMGIADTEFTDDNQTVNPGGHIHLYTGGHGPGAEINSSTPVETTLTENSATLNGYDMVMFPCQGGSISQNSTALNNLLSYADTGGRLFTTHFSYDYIDPNSPYDSPFPPVANWTTDAEQQINSGVGTVATNFSDGATLAQWLQNAGATDQGSANEIEISTLRTDVSSVIPPTQSWLTYNSGSNPVMQMTFNTPVGAPANNQCGRVMYNDYHVISASIPAGTVYPNECHETGMSAQEQMLEYALFDLSTFVQPVVNPTLNIAFNPSPLVVKSGDTADQLTVSVDNYSTTTETGSSAILSFTLPPQLTITAMSDPSGGWICTPGTATCTRNSSLPASITDSVTLTISVAPYTTLPSYTSTITATVSSVTFSTNPSATDNVTFQEQPAITWATPAPIIYGAALSSIQLDATAAVPGTFTYSPATGTVLPVGQQALNVTFAPTDTVHYAASTASVTLTVNPATPNITLSTSANDVFLTNAVTFTATIPLPGVSLGGTITFYDGETQIGSATVNSGSASITTSTLAAGTQFITAVYSGDSNYGPATSSPVTETIQDFTITAAGGGTANALPATDANFTLVVTPVNGSILPGGINLSVTGLPVGTSASFSPASINPNSPTTNVVLTVHLAGSASAAAHKPSSFGKAGWPVALALVLIPFGVTRRWRKGRSLLLLALLAAAALIGVSGCGGSALAQQSFSFPVAAQSGALSHAVTVTLTIEPPQN
jgi:hypothetical protein